MTALYLDVKKDLLDKITSGEYPEGTIIPTEHELSDIYCVSRPTIRKAVQILVDAGYLEKKKKRGTIVCIPKVIQDFTQTISSFDTQMKRHGIVSQTQVISFKKEQASKEIAKEVKPDFIKTSTGFGTGGATFEDVALMKKYVGDEVEVKAAGGIRNADTFIKMIENGATRIGTSAGVSIIEELKKKAVDGVIKI